jgi:hypothetical protein
MLEFAVGTGNFKEIKCPASATDKCTGVLDGNDVEAFANRETYKKCARVSVSLLVIACANIWQVRQIHDRGTIEV